MLVRPRLRFICSVKLLLVRLHGPRIARAPLQVAVVRVLEAHVVHPFVWPLVNALVLAILIVPRCLLRQLLCPLVRVLAAETASATKNIACHHHAPVALVQIQIVQHFRCALVHHHGREPRERGLHMRNRSVHQCHLRDTLLHPNE